MSYSPVTLSNRARANKARATHGHAPRGAHTATYRSWVSMRSRCCKKGSQAYEHYGARGITVCDRWLKSFQNFLIDMGECPPGCSIDRIDNDRGYEPDNCRWATRAEQNRNRRSNVLVTIDGVTKCMTDWAIENGIRPDTASQRLQYGWDVVRAVSQPVRRAA